MSSRPHPNDIQRELCALAERIASEVYGTQLDYSVDSIRQVERILGAFHEEYVKTRSEEGLNGIAMEFAAYIVTTIQRHFGPAQWERDCPSLGKDAFPLHWRDSSIYPFAWCQKRIFDGPADDVWCKFQVLVLDKTRPPRSWWRFWRRGLAGDST
jgi:hypothetical protein